jgi:hypothetical protein
MVSYKWEINSGNAPAARKPAGFNLKKGDTAMTAITITVPPDVLRRIDDLRQLELLSRAAWLRREVVLAVRANDHVEATKMEAKENA